MKSFKIKKNKNRVPFLIREVRGFLPKPKFPLKLFKISPEEAISLYRQSENQAPFELPDPRQ